MSLTTNKQEPTVGVADAEPPSASSFGDLPEPTTSDDAARSGPRISIVIPVLNEAKNLRQLIPETVDVLNEIGDPYEIIVVDDGSTDGSFSVLRELHETYDNLTAIRLGRNYGQTAAMAAGFQHSTGQWVVSLDGDLQNDPRDIPRLLAKAEEGYDVVSGWRKDRKDPFLHRKLPSAAANALISRITGVHLHDYGCTLKVYKGDVIREVNLYGELHRFIPALTSWQGAKVTEMPVHHRPRKSGSSSYGLSRIFKVALDLITVKFLLHFARHPIRVFGGSGLMAFLIGSISGLAVLYMKLSINFSINRNPLLYVTIFLFSIGIQFILMGLLAELVIRTYYESSGKLTYHIREVLE